MKNIQVMLCKLAGAGGMGGHGTGVYVLSSRFPYPVFGASYFPSTHECCCSSGVPILFFRIPAPVVLVLLCQHSVVNTDS